MRNLVELEVLANWVSMIRPGIRGAILLPDDEEEGRFYERCAHPHARVVPATNSAIPLHSIVRSRGVRGVVAMVRGSNVAPSPNDGVFRPERGDVASLLVLSSAYSDVVRDFGGAAWFAACEDVIGDLRCCAAVIARTYTRVTGAPKECVPNLPTLNEFCQAVDWQDGRIATESLKKLLGGWVPQGIDDVFSTIADSDALVAIQECDGMDVLGVLCHAMSHCRPHGLAARRTPSPIELMAGLRTAFALEDLELDEMCWQIALWQRHNRQYPLLKTWRLCDPLGVLLDQRYWENDLKRLFTRMTPSDHGAVVKMDLDNFKLVNERLGHSVGDEAIKMYCEIVASILSIDGEAYRRGGDETVTIIPATSHTRLSTACERARAMIEDKFGSWCKAKGLDHPITASIGAVMFRHDSSIDSVLHRLDVSQMQAKQKGKNRVVIDAELVEGH